MPDAQLDQCLQRLQYAEDMLLDAADCLWGRPEWAVPLLKILRLQGRVREEREWLDALPPQRGHRLFGR